MLYSRPVKRSAVSYAADASISTLTTDLSTVGNTVQNFLSSAPSLYVSQDWLTLQNYLTSIPANYATQEWVTSQNYLTEVPITYRSHTVLDHFAKLCHPKLGEDQYTELPT